MIRLCTSATFIVMIMAIGCKDATLVTSAFSVEPFHKVVPRTLSHRSTASSTLFPSNLHPVTCNLKQVFVRNLALVVAATLERSILLRASREEQKHLAKSIDAEIIGVNDLDESNLMTPDIRSSPEQLTPVEMFMNHEKDAFEHEPPTSLVVESTISEGDGLENSFMMIDKFAHHDKIENIPPEDPLEKELFWSSKEERLMLAADHDTPHMVQSPPQDALEKEIFWSTLKERSMLPAHQVHVDLPPDDIVEREEYWSTKGERWMLPAETEHEAKIAEARRQPKSPEVEAALQAKYAAIHSLEERMFQILLDLGMIERTGDE